MMNEDDTRAHFSLKDIQEKEKSEGKKRKKKKNRKKAIEAKEAVQDNFKVMRL